jgi:hypothetical protein
MKTLILKKQSKRYSHSQDKYFEFKETECGRFFVFVPDNTHKASQFSAEKKKEGHCIELMKKSFAHFSKSEKERAASLNKNTQKDLKYKGNSKENAINLYKSKSNNKPYVWSYIIDENNYGDIYTDKVLSQTEPKSNSKGEVIKYNRAFFDSIKFDELKANKFRKELEKVTKNELKIIGASFIDDPVKIKNTITITKLHDIFKKHTENLRKELEKVLPKEEYEKLLLSRSVDEFSISLKTKDHSINYSAFSYIK